MDNLIIDELDPRAQLISGSPKPLSMMQGIDETFDGVMYIGYHARSGTSNGVFNHTYDGTTISNISINGKPMGECGINAGVAGHFGVPILAISGDDLLCQQAIEEIGDLQTIEVKKAISRYCAHNVAKSKLREIYAEKIKAAFENIKNSPVVKYEGKVSMEIEFTKELLAERAMLYPHAVRVDSKTIRVEADNYMDLFMMFRGCINLV